VSNLVPAAAFGEAFPAIEEKHGWRILRARAHPVRSSEANMGDLLETIERGLGLDAAGQPIPKRRARPPKGFFLLGYSKGTSDALTLLAHHPELAARTRALVCWGGAVGGSYVADGVYEAIKDVEIPQDLGGPLVMAIRALLPVARLEGLAERLDEYDVKGAVRDLTTRRRAEFLKQHGKAIDALDVPIFNVAAVAGPLEVPYFQLQGSLDIGRRAGENDMQLSVAQSCVKAPMATNLAVLHGHHWDISYDAFPRRFRLGAANLEHRFPREAAVTALFLLLAELGLID
jgi:pimeloyl-ACP methyl ester carboxylesterase